ncbi:gephyrin-like molybdotransferase Glp [Alkalilacustris brevis]|uniref:molybdopterin molybdotransferase MoeA n=1 Tax=Alkalilacustris brevis TaxID=2026338 RepID=UPI000E0CF5BA|nr:gephyrin-like molybdotransferase Glp [Alkalilacustris brevis]
MIPVAEALEKVLALVPPPRGEAVPLAEAAGRVLLAPARAARDQPPFAASAMDGYAVAGAGLKPGARLRVVGEAAAGHGHAGRIKPGEALRIFTGAPLPEGSDTVVIQEDVTRDGEMIRLDECPEPGAHVRPRGGDFAAGDEIAAPRRLRPADLALLAAMNVPELQLARRPEVAFIATGDELVMPGEAPRDDQIIASNIFALQAMARAEGAETRILPIARDTPLSLRTVLELAAGADLILTIGGASVGDHDLVGQVAQEIGMERAFYKIAMRPGKPLMAGRLGGAMMLGLPGNPVSAIVCGQIFMLPALRAMQGLPEPVVPPRRARLGCALPPNGPRTHYMRARLAPPRDGEGLPLITPFARQDSALLSVLTEADALLIRPVRDPERKPGDLVEYLPI